MLLTTYQTKSVMAEYDIVIMGAGPVGLTFAAAVARLPIKIAIIDQKKHTPVWSKQNYPTRVSAITPSSEFALRRLGVWNAIVQQRISTFTSTYVWDSVGMGDIEFTAAELGFPHLGHIIENDVLINALWQHCESQDNIDCFLGVNAESFYPHATGAELIAETQSFDAKLFVAADGAHSWLRQQAGIEQSVKPYQHTAIIATVATEEYHAKTSRQCFLPSGPLAFLPLSPIQEQQNLCSIVWSVLPELADELMALDTTEFCNRLAEAFDYRLGNIELMSQRVALPLVMRHAKQYFANHTVLIGDAAHTIHPLAGQGMNLGIMDACQLAENLAKAIEQKRPLNSEKILRQYARARSADNQLMANLMQGFKSLFSIEAGAVPTIRSMGLQFANQCKPVKHLMLRRAMGLIGEKPKITEFHPELLVED